jgi:prolipoprotein diacylglyceryltransferase
LYESLGCLLIFTFLLFLNYKWKNKIDDKKAIIIIIFYLIAYSLLRFSLEFIKVDITPMLWGWRWPQIMSLIIITTSLIYLFINYHPFKHKTKN